MLETSDIQSSIDGLAHGAEPIERSLGFRPAMSSDGNGWRQLSLYLWRGRAEACEFVPFGEAIAVFHTGGAHDVRVRMGRRWIDERSHPGLVTIIPPATPITWRIAGEVHSCSLHLPPERFANLIDGAKGETAISRLRFQFARTEPFVAALMSALVEEVESPSERGSLYADTLADGLVLHLLRRYADPAPSEPPRGGLSRRALEESRHRIEASLETGLSLDALARGVGLSRSHFARSFRRSTGESPHEYLTRRRIARARELLVGTDDAIVEIALACGFSSQAHFTQSFRRATGTTPLVFRRSRS